MNELSKKLESIVKEFMEKNVPAGGKHDFVIAAIHFNINLNVCTKYDLMRIDHKAKDLANVENNLLLTKASIYSYILFRALNHKQISVEDIPRVKRALIEISTEITDYMTYRIDEETLNKALFNILNEILN